MAKADLIAEAQALNITLTGEETVAQLEQLIAAAKPVVPRTDTPPTPSTPPADEKVTEVEVKYRDHAGETVSRVFSKAVHGADWKKLAEEFKATNASKIVA